MDELYLGIPLSNWVFAASLSVGVLCLVPAIRGMIRRKIPKADGPSRGWRGLVGQLNVRWMKLTTLVLALAPAAVILSQDLRVVSAAKIAFVAIITLQLIRFIPVVLDWAMDRVAHAQGDAATQAAVGTLAGLRWLVLFVVYAVVLLLVLQNLGVDVTSLIAGMGIGGIAVALAMQNILGDLFASLTIALDKPFVVGGFIVVGSEMGSVEHVGLKTTRVRSLSDEQLVFGNADLLSSRIRNYKRITERRVLFGFGVVYSTSADMLEEIGVAVREIITAQENVRFDRCHFHRFGESSLDFEVVYSINPPDYNAHMDVQKAVHLAIVRAFEQREIGFALPRGPCNS